MYASDESKYPKIAVMRPIVMIAATDRVGSGSTHWGNSPVKTTHRQQGKEAELDVLTGPATQTGEAVDNFSIWSGI